MKEKTPKEYEAIIRKLIFSNSFKSMWHPKADSKNCVRVSVNYGPIRYTWEGSENETINVPLDYLFKKVMGS